MIHIQRTPAPQGFLELDIRTTQLNDIRRWLSSDTVGKTLPNLIARTYQLPALEEAVATEYHHKCAICERILSPEEGRVSYFRPLANAQPLALGEMEDKAYYSWLVWDWSNLTFTCRECLEYQPNHFPVTTKRATLEVHHLDRENARPYFVNEQPLLIDPGVEAPAQHLNFNERGEIKPRDGSPFGDYVIQRYDLNRQPLVDARQVEIARLMCLWEDAYKATAPDQHEQLKDHLAALLAACANEQQFAGMKRQLLLDWVHQKQNEAETPQFMVDALSQQPWQDTVSQLERMLFPVDALLRLNAESTILIRDLTRIYAGEETEQQVLQQMTVIIGDVVIGDMIAGDKVSGDRITVGNIKGSQVSIGRS